MTLVTQRDARLQGATDAIDWLGGLAIVSPVTSEFVAVDFTVALDRAPSLDLSTVIPHSVDRLDASRLIVAGVRGIALVDGTLAVPTVTQYLEGGVKWAIGVQSLAEVVRRISTSAAYLRRTENADRRIIDVRSRNLILAATADGITLYDDAFEVVDTLAITAEAAAFDAATGQVFLISSSSIQIITITADERLEVVATTGLAKNVQGPVAARVISGVLHVLCERRKRVLHFDATTTDFVPLTDTALASATLYWERNPLRAVSSGGDDLTRFGSVLATPTDLPLTAGETGWVLHGEIAALTGPEPYHAPLPPVPWDPPASDTEEWAIQAHIDYGANNPGPWPLSGQNYRIADLLEYALTAGLNSPCGSPYLDGALGSLGGTVIPSGAVNGPFYAVFHRGQAVLNGIIGPNEAVHFRMGHGTSVGFGGAFPGGYSDVIHEANLSLWYRPNNAAAWVQVGAEINKTGLTNGVGWGAGYPPNACTLNPIDWGGNSNWATAYLPEGTLA